MRISFVLPGYSPVPVGGYKIVYEYANRLTERGHRVTVVHPHRASNRPAANWPAHLKSRLWPLWIRARDRKLVPWFALRPDVRLLLVPDLSEKFMPDADAVFATAWQTARPVHQLDAAKGQKYYFIQHHETGPGDPRQAEVDSTWTLPLRKVVNARWLLEIAQQMGEGERTTHIPYGMDFSHFVMTSPPEARPPRVGMLYHRDAWKGSADAMAALETVRAQMPELKAVAFGTPPRPPAFPAWMEYVQTPSPPDLNALYNNCSIWVQASWSEGWGLTASEAMACGCALVTTDNGGAREYAVEEKTALLAPIENSPALAAQLWRLLRDDDLRCRLARAGHEHVHQFTWERAVNALEALLKK